jgi:hypothetical protein
MTPSVRRKSGGVNSRPRLLLPGDVTASTTLLVMRQPECDGTADRNLSFQQNTAKFQIAVVVLVADSSTIDLFNMSVI